MESSVNGTENTTPQWNRNDGYTDCDIPDGAPPLKVTARPAKFCQDVTIDGNLVVEGNVVIKGTLTVTGTITAPFFDGVAARAVVASSLG